MLTFQIERWCLDAQNVSAEFFVLASIPKNKSTKSDIKLIK
jgi:hypothetical protein